MEFIYEFIDSVLTAPNEVNDFVVKFKVSKLLEHKDLAWISSIKIVKSTTPEGVAVVQIQIGWRERNTSSCESLISQSHFLTKPKDIHSLVQKACSEARFKFPISKDYQR